MNQIPKTKCDKLPYEKYLEEGVSSLSDAELIALILRNGSHGHPIQQVVHELFQKDVFVQHGIKGFFYLSAEDITHIQGIGAIKASQILSIVELSKRIHQETFKESFCFKSPDQAYFYYKDMFLHLDREEVFVVYLNSKLRRIKDEILTIGTNDMSLISPRDVYKCALKYNASHILLMHNHPSGDPIPGASDINVTVTMEKAGKLLGISLVDHIIIGEYRYYSMFEHGILGGQ